MKRIMLLAILVCFSMPGFTQEKVKPEGAKPETAIPETAKPETAIPETAKPHLAVPKPLDDDFMRWMIGEWEGSSVSSMGKTQDWQKIEWDLDGQFMVIHSTSKAFEITPQQLDAMAKAFQIPKADAERIKNVVSKGMGIITIDPTSGEIFGFWLDNLRSISEGNGKREGNKFIMEWENEEGHSKYIIEKAGDDKMIMLSTVGAPSGEAIQSRTEMMRKK